MVVARLEPARLHGRLDVQALLSRLLIGAGFVPVWLATGLLFVVTAIVSPATLGHDSFSGILPLMSILAVAGPLTPLFVPLALRKILLGVRKWYAHGIAKGSPVPASLSKFATERW